MGQKLSELKRDLSVKMASGRNTPENKSENLNTVSDGNVDGGDSDVAEGAVGNCDKSVDAQCNTNGSECSNNALSISVGDRDASARHDTDDKEVWVLQNDIQIRENLYERREDICDRNSNQNIYERSGNIKKETVLERGCVRIGASCQEDANNDYVEDSPGPSDQSGMAKYSDLNEFGEGSNCDKSLKEEGEVTVNGKVTDVFTHCVCHMCTCQNHQPNKNVAVKGEESSSDSAPNVEMEVKVECLAAQRREERNQSTRRTFRTLTFGRRQRAKAKSPKLPKEVSGKKKNSPWTLRLTCKLKGIRGSDNDIPEPSVEYNSCVCIGYRRTEEHHLGAGVVFETTPPTERRKSSQQSDSNSNDEAGPTVRPQIDFSKFNPADYPIDDCDEHARQERAREIAEGVDAPSWFHPNRDHVTYPPEFSIDNLTALFQNSLGVLVPQYPLSTTLTNLDLSSSSFLSHWHLNIEGALGQRVIHTQVDYIHCLVPDLLQITNCSFYWGKMDRYEAETLLEYKPEGTFLLRDSAQEEYLFSVSFRRYGRSLHARIEQWNHTFSFDSHDPGVFASETVCGLIEHYKDPSCCMFFEPMLTYPLHRNFTFPLQHLCRATICSCTSYDGINHLQLPKSLKNYLKEYHYKQRVRVRRLEVEP